MWLEVTPDGSRSPGPDAGTRFPLPRGSVVTVGLGFYMLHNTLQTNATQMVPESRGLAMSLFAFMLFSGQSVGVALAAPVMDRFGGQPIFLSGHLDTVAPTTGLEVVEQDDVYRMNGRTILGADDKCAVSALLEAALQIEERCLPHGPLRLLLSVVLRWRVLGSKLLQGAPHHAGAVAQVPAGYQVLLRVRRQILPHRTSDLA